jgi:hypothetical protein
VAREGGRENGGKERGRSGSASQKKEK